VGVPGGERGNIQTGRGDRVNTMSQLGCSTSVALAMGPTDEEEEELASVSDSLLQTDRILHFTPIFIRNP